MLQKQKHISCIYSYNGSCYRDNIYMRMFVTVCHMANFTPYIRPSLTGQMCLYTRVEIESMPLKIKIKLKKNNVTLSWDTIFVMYKYIYVFIHIYCTWWLMDTKKIVFFIYIIKIKLFYGIPCLSSYTCGICTIYLTRTKCAPHST